MNEAGAGPPGPPEHSECLSISVSVSLHFCLSAFTMVTWESSTGEPEHIPKPPKHRAVLGRLQEGQQPVCTFWAGKRSARCLPLTHLAWHCGDVPGFPKQGTCLGVPQTQDRLCLLLTYLSPGVIDVHSIWRYSQSWRREQRQEKEGAGMRSDPRPLSPEGHPSACEDAQTQHPPGDNWLFSWKQYFHVTSSSSGSEVISQLSPWGPSFPGMGQSWVWNPDPHSGWRGQEAWAQGGGGRAVRLWAGPQSRNLGQVRPEAGGDGYLVSGALTTWGGTGWPRQETATHSFRWVDLRPAREDAAKSSAGPSQLLPLRGPRLIWCRHGWTVYPSRVLCPVTHLPFWVLWLNLSTPQLPHCLQRLRSRHSFTLVNDHTPADHSPGGTLATGGSCLGDHVTVWPGDSRGGQDQWEPQFPPACRGAMPQPSMADASPQGGVKSCLFLL